MIAPRILMISDEGPQTGTAGGLLLHRLLAGHPADRLHVVARYVPTLGEPLPGVVYRALTPPWQRFEKSRFNRLKRSLRAVGLVPSVSLSTLAALVGDFQPEVVLCVMQHAAFYDAAAHFARAHRLPLIVIVHDVNDDFEPVLSWAKSAALKRDAAFYQQAQRRLCVSPQMETYCHQHYGSRGQVLYPNRSPDLRPIHSSHAQTLRNGSHLTIGFAGNLGYGYGRELVRLLPALRTSGSRLIIYSRPPSEDCAALAEATDCVDLRGFKPAAEVWAEIQRDCDAVWLAYPVQAEEFTRLYRTHFPSKLPEYLALGLPVIVSGPDYATGVSWAQQQAEAIVTSINPTLTHMTAIFNDLTHNAARRQQLAADAVRVGDRDFDPQHIVAQFNAHVHAAITDKPTP
jgi:glycosyltransferase involved in cell wall biosynthesis